MEQIDVPESFVLWWDAGLARSPVKLASLCMSSNCIQVQIQNYAHTTRLVQGLIVIGRSHAVSTEFPGILVLTDCRAPDLPLASDRPMSGHRLSRFCLDA